MNIETIFPGGEWKTPEEYVIKCPICGDHQTHFHCYVNSERGVYKCWFCGEGGSLKALIGKYGGGESFTAPRKGIVEKQRYERLDFSKFPEVTGEGGKVDRLALGYLLKRGLTKSDIKRYGIRYSDRGRFSGRVLLPIIEDNEIVCFSARSFFSWNKPKYLFPHHDQMKLTTSECVWGIDAALEQNRVIITEGIFDAIAVNRLSGKLGIAAVSLLSKNMSVGQCHKLLALGHGIEFIVLLDSDARDDGLKIAKQLHAYGRRVLVGEIAEGDPASLSIEELEEVILRTQPYGLMLEVSQI